MASDLFATFKRDVMKASYDFTGGAMWCMLLANTYTTVDATGDTGYDFRNDITTFEVATTNYTAGGVIIGTAGVQTVSADTTNDWAYWDSTVDPQWTSITVTARYAVVYKSTGSAATDGLIAIYDFGSDQTATNGTFTVQWSTLGLIRLS